MSQLWWWCCCRFLFWGAQGASQLPGLFYTQCNSFCTAVCNSLDKPVQDAFELFAGGFAGWKQAVTALNQQELINLNVCHAI